MAQASWNATKQMMAAKHGPANPGDMHIPLGKWDPGTGLDWVTRALLYFPVSFSGMTAITNAYIEVHMHEAAGWHANGGSTATVYARRKTADWSESSHGSSSGVDESWGGDGDHLVESGYAGQQSGDLGNISAGLSDGAVESINVTEIVKDWFNGSPNYGVMLYNASSETNSGYGLEFYSRHHSTYRPTLVVEYETNTAPNAPINTEPDNDAVRASNVLSMRHDDPDSGDEANSAAFDLKTAAGDSVNYASSGSYVSGNGLDCSWGAYPLVSGRRYRWRGRTYDGQEWGPYSAYAYFYYEPSQPAPTLSTPANGAEISTLTPNLACTHNLLGDSTMSHGQAQIRDASGVLIWDSGSFGDTGSQALIAVPGGVLDWASDYDYRMRVRTSLGTWSAWSSYRPFSTQGAGSPQNVAPSGIKVADAAAVSISFDAAAGDTITRWQYEVFASGGSSIHLEPYIDNVDASSISVVADLSAVCSPGGDYEIRVRYEDEVSAESPWSSKQAFSINAPPSAPALISPAQGSVIETLTPTFEWDFNDPDEGEWGDAQSAYTLEVRDNATDALIDTLIGTTAEFRDYDGVALAFETTYKWRVLAEDEEGVTSAYSSYLTFTPSQPPTASAVQIAAADLDTEGEINGPTPTVEWTYASPGSKAQDSFRVAAVRVLDEGTVYDSGWVSGADASFTIPLGYLADEETYRFDVQVRDTDLLEGTGSTANALTDFAPPAEIEGIVTVADSGTSKITVEWEAPASDPEFDHIEVWRRPYGTDDWRVLSDTIGEGVTSYNDYTAALNKTYEYAVLQVHTVGTGLVQGAFSPVTTALSGVPQWYLVAEGRDDLTVALEWAENASDTIPIQQDKIEALGRPFKIVVEGRVLGSEGEITVRVDGTEYEQVEAIETLLRARLARVLIKSPTGEVYPSKMGSIRRERLRHGAVGVSFPYTQIEEA